MVKFSVIVPVYRTEDYLEQAVHSLLDQTYPNLEIILVDDGSPDRCGALCDGYAAIDRRIKVIHKQNGGLSSARKSGIDAASGDYLVFMDSDDWMEPDTFALAAARIDRDDPDCLLFGYVKEYGEISIPVHLFESEFSYDLKDAENDIHRRIVGLTGAELAHPERIDQLSATCMKIYRIDAARRGKIVSERETGTGEDLIFNLYALENCRISYLDRCLYHYRKTNDQSITTAHKADLAEKWDVMYGYVREYIEQAPMGETYEAAYYNRIACGMIGLGLNEIAADKSVFEKARSLRRIVSKAEYCRAFREVQLRYCPLKWKVFFLLCRYRMSLLLVFLLSFINYLRSRVSA